MPDPQEQAQEQTQETAEESLLDSILAETKLKPEDETYIVAKQGLQALLTHILVDKKEKAPKIRQAVVNEMIADLDKTMSAQINEVLHHEQFQKLESAWRGLKYVIDQSDFRENVKVELLNVSKEDLLADFEDSPEVVKSGLYRKVYSDNYGVHGGEPVAAMVGNYDFGPGPQDLSLLQYCASVGNMAHAPFVAAAGPEFFGEKDFLNMPNLKDLASIFEGPQYAKWNSFRESEDSRNVALAMPRFLLRLPYGQSTIPVKEFEFEESSDKHDAYLWGNAAFAFATRLTDSFAKYRFCTNIIGPKGGGNVEDLPVHVFESKGSMEQKIPTEVLLTERREFELAEQGFIGLTMRKGSDNACFFSANSCQKAKFFGKTPEGKAKETNYKLGLQLPYMMMMNRLAHYLKVLQREEIGSTKSRVEIERELNRWVSQYVLDQDVATAGSYARKPLRAASITVSDVEGEPGWYKIDFKAKPHFKYMGAYFELSLVGSLDKAEGA